MNPSLQPAVEGFLKGLTQSYATCNPDAAWKEREAANVRRVHDLYAALGNNDVPAFAAGLADDVLVEIIAPPDSPIGGTWQGKQTALLAIAKNFSLFADQKPRPEFVVAREDHVMVIAQETGRYLPTGRPYDIRWMQSFTLRDGRVVHFREVLSGPGPWEEKEN